MTTAHDITARLASFNPLVVGTTVYVPAYHCGFGTAAECLLAVAVVSGTDAARWRRHQPCKNVAGYWLLECEPPSEQVGG